MPRTIIIEDKWWKFLTDVKDLTLKPEHIVIQKSHFFMEAYWNAASKLLYWWIYYIGPQKQADCYKYTIKFINKTQVNLIIFFNTENYSPKIN